MVTWQEFLYQLEMTENLGLQNENKQQEFISNFSSLTVQARDCSAFAAVRGLIPGPALFTSNIKGQLHIFYTLQSVYWIWKEAAMLPGAYRRHHWKQWIRLHKVYSGATKGFIILFFFLKNICCSVYI